MFTIHRIQTLPDDLTELAASAHDEGHYFIDRLIVDFNKGKNSFTLAGEALFVAREAGKLLGVGGLNQDPYCRRTGVGRVRHLYVHPDARGKGAGWELLVNIEREAWRHFEELRLYTDNPVAGALYAKAGFREYEGRDKASHVKCRSWLPQKACPLVLRKQGETGVEILAFEHPLAGKQLVKGGIESGEDAAEAALRELHEESGIEGAISVGELTAFVVGPPDQFWRVVLCKTGELPGNGETWNHDTKDDGGHRFRFFWHPLFSEPGADWHLIFRQTLAQIQQALQTL